MVSLEEAKKITASFEGQSFVPPPRTITDVTAILDAQKRDDPIAAREINEALNAQPPATAKRRVLAEFYYDRGRLARPGHVGCQHRESEMALRRYAFDRDPVLVRTGPA